VPGSRSASSTCIVRAIVKSSARPLVGLVRRVALPISAGLLASGPRYVEALTAYRDGEPDPILQVFADSAVRSAAEGRRLGHEVHGIHAGWSEILAALDEFAARAGRRVPLR